LNPNFEFCLEVAFLTLVPERLFKFLAFLAKNTQLDLTVKLLSFSNYEYRSFQLVE